MDDQRQSALVSASAGTRDPHSNDRVTRSRGVITTPPSTQRAALSTS